MPEKFKTSNTPEHGIPFILYSVLARGDPLRWQKSQSTFPPEEAGLPTKWFHNSKVCFALAP
ncbi:hypothetical protein BDV27DRAFT_119879 [Aspergillus caelatus]|uniref:Uncharacterized protein n=2 Tax=Aspergillus subgen. Circumdati TaxID=2720871 RepID=A0A5N7AJY5_9EURO|nr:uncharacterized protein BDV27DRAFT_119879 [Aspergillus caelatus]KAE8370013.1 hypothetical protein BDV27DRAFT_119879 [Aspergillus caelatus]